LNYPLFDALFNRRSRRFGLGFELKGTNLSYKSEKKPHPLSTFQEAMITWAGTGLTGLCIADLPPDAINLLCQWTGRTWPSACNPHSTELFLSNDSGLYMIEANKLLPEDKEINIFARLSQEKKIEKLLKLYEESLLKLEDGRPDLPDKMPGLFTFNEWNTNKPGSSLFIPVTDITEEYLNLLCLYCSNSYGFQIVDDIEKCSAGQDKWIKEGRIKSDVKISLFELETRILTGLNVEQAFICQNMALSLQALGLGGWTFTGLLPRYTLGSNPEQFKGLGFRFISPKKGKGIEQPQGIPVGKDGVFEAYCPPYYKNMDDAFDAFYEKKYKTWNREEESMPHPYLEPDKQLMEAPKTTEKTIRIVKDVINYIYDTYGRFPAFVDPMYMRLVFQAHNLDLDFYDKYYPPGTYTDQHVNTFKYFHPDKENPYKQKPEEKQPWDK
ncbi:hypothetical protein HOG00_01300, partial [bacterium]|nr:hypothetical protein [bacterium]